MARMKLRSVSVLGVAVWHGLYSLIFAVLLGLIYSGYILLVYGNLPASYLVYYMLVIPAVYCPLGFMAYGLVAIIYNSIARHSGGITLEIETAADQIPPPPPSF
jgi:hypothetical protein